MGAGSMIIAAIVLGVVCAVLVVIIDE